MSCTDLFLKLKHALPFNGDWLYPTSPPTDTEPVEDLAETYSAVEKVLESIPPLLPGFAERLMTESNRLAQLASVRRDTVRDKAKVLLGTSSFVGAAITAILSLSVQHVKSLPNWVRWPFVVLFALMLVQFGLALVRSMRAMTREKIQEITAPQLGRILREAQSPEEFTRHLAANRIALANRNLQFVTEKVNDLILGQVGFGIGLVYALILLLVLAIAFAAFGVTDRKPEAVTAEVVRTELLTATQALQKQLNDLQTMSSAQALSARNEVERLSLRIDELIKNLQKISGAVWADIQGRKPKDVPNEP